MCSGSCDRSLRKSVELHLNYTGKRLVKLLLKESENVIAKIDTETEIKLQKCGEVSQEKASPT